MRDRNAARLVESFYDELANGHTAGDALRLAKLELRRKGAPAAEWAAFTLVGDGTVRLPLRTRARPIVWIVSVALLIALGIAARFAARARRRRPS